MNLQMTYDLHNTKKALPLREGKSIEEKQQRASITWNVNGKDATPLFPRCKLKQQPRALILKTWGTKREYKTPGH